MTINKSFPVAAPNATDATAWTFEVRAGLGAKYLRLEFAAIEDTTRSDYEVVIFGSALTRVATYTKAQFSRRTNFWSPIIRGDYARVMVLTSDGQPPIGLTYQVVQYLYESPSAVLESVIDPRNPRLKPLSAFASDPAVQLAAKSVAKLRNVGRDGLSVCTGFMVSPDLLLTNEHCVPNERICAMMQVYFNWDPLRDDGSNLFECVKLERVNANLDFALVRLNGRPGDAHAWGLLRLETREPRLGENLYIVQYPGIREPKQVARDNCALTDPVAPGVVPKDRSDFAHTCDTKQGSSGSPVLATENRVIGLHHWGFDLPDPDWRDRNRAVRMQAISTAISDMLK